MQHLTTLLDLSPDDVHELIELALDLKRRKSAGERPQLLENHVLMQIFEKPSLRTRNSFEAAIIQVGGSGIFMTAQEAGLHGRESLSDIAKVASSYADFVTLRTFEQSLISEFAQHAQCPVINALSDDRHPCQALTDLTTVYEALGELRGKRIVFVGDGNNVASSLALACAMTQASFVLTAPPGYELDDAFVTDVRSRFTGCEIEQISSPIAAVKGADVVYTDVWASMGQESEAQDRARAFADFQVNKDLMAHAPAKCRFMHDLPAKRGLEVTDNVMDSPNSLVFTQAENRMHLAKALLVWLSKRRS